MMVLLHWFVMLLAFAFAGVVLRQSGKAISYRVVHVANTAGSNPGSHNNNNKSWQFKLIMIIICQGLACLFVWIITILPLPAGLAPPVLNLVDFATLFAACFAAIFSYPAFLLD